MENQPENQKKIAQKVWYFNPFPTTYSLFYPRLVWLIKPDKLAVTHLKYALVRDKFF
jgi:hypothetical protein